MNNRNMTRDPVMPGQKPQWAQRTQSRTRDAPPTARESGTVTPVRRINRAVLHLLLH